MKVARLLSVVHMSIAPMSVADEAASKNNVG